MITSRAMGWHYIDHVTNSVESRKSRGYGWAWTVVVLVVAAGVALL